MRTKLFPLLVVCLVCLFSAVATPAQMVLKINETEIKAIFTGSQLQTALTIENPAQPLTANVRLEILDAEDKILAESVTRQNVKRGRAAVQIPLVFNQKQDTENLLWKRLRYTVAPENSPDTLSGIVSLSEIMPEIYDLQISAPESVFAGMNLRAHVLAVHPLTKEPIKNVEISGEVQLDLETDADEDEMTVKANGKTNAEGFATLDFKIPAGITLDDCCNYIQIKGAKNGILRDARQQFEESVKASVYLNTDKPIYQPAQKLFVRGLYLDGSKRPAAAKELAFEISDEEGNRIYQAKVTTSRFGIANIEWQIPENFKLGTYRIQVENNDGDEVGKGEFKVTRYDLPNFTVKAETDKTFYLPEQTTANITVNAEYLFGKPVAHGKVKIVLERTRNWNYWRQKYDTEEGGVYEGETNADGKFIALIDLSEAHKSLQNQYEQRFEDLHFAAYFTDSTTNRTEQKRFDVRLSLEPIHVYFIRPAQDGNPNMPIQFYVSTFYADGSPAVCGVQIKGFYENAKYEKILIEAKTNSYGAGKFEIRFPEKPFPEASNRFYLQISATDKNGRRGEMQNNLFPDKNRKQVLISTDKTIYAPNANIEAKIFSSEMNGAVYVDVIKNSTVLYSRRVKTSDGRGTLQIPFRADFKGELAIVAYLNDEDYYRDYVSHSKIVIFPAANNLNLNFKTLKTVYRPNEAARISFNVMDDARKPLETALGIVILDKAIEERAQTEQLPDNLKDLRKLIGTADVFGKLTRRDLDNLDASKPIKADLQLAAEFLLTSKSFEPNFFKTDNYALDFDRTYKKYFAAKLQALENALQTTYEKTGDFPQNEISLRRMLAANDINYDDLRDAWNTPLRVQFAADRAFTVLSFKTASADKKFETEDDFTVKEMRFEWFKNKQERLNVILNNYLQTKATPPQTPDELKAIWQRAGLNADDWRDGWNRPLYLTSVNYNRNSQKVVPETVGTFDGETQQVLRVTAVSQEVVLFRLRSAGADGIKETGEDFDVAAFTVVVSEKDLAGDQTNRTKISKSLFSSANGAIGGVVTDQAGAVIPNAELTATNQNSQEKFSVRSDGGGEFLMVNLPSGKYNVSTESPGFMKHIIENVVVSPMNLIRLEIVLEVGAMAQTVDVTAQSVEINSSSSALKSFTSSESRSIADALKQNKNAPVFTPRVREYFPETLLWSPELITDKNGRAALDFKFGDNLTTWKLYAVGSTETGEIGLIEKEFKTFQPFFAELDPPKILTTGDEISLPVPVRNYTEKRQKVAVSMAANDWSKMLDDATQNIEIAPNSTQNAIFNFRAASSVKDGKQKVSALAKADGDAIEKTVTVNPYGRETVQTQSNTFQSNTSFEVNFPTDAFPATRQTEIKIYPNMLAHVGESVRGLLERPHGCGEQTTSSTYPNLLILKIEKEFGEPIDANLKKQANNYLEEGYKRLLNYQTDSGGFSYWGKTDTPDAALTAYILRFLSDAEKYIEVDETVVENARKWLLKQQQPDGSWKRNASETDVVTAYAVRSLALVAGNDESVKESVRRGLGYLRKPLPDANDSFVLANTALAALTANDAEAARESLEKLPSLAQTENESLYWKTANTPFHGWGKPAEIETTALVVQAFLKFQVSKFKFQIEEQQIADLISKGTFFLLKNKDRYGVWHSTQTTVNVLDALISLQKMQKEKTGAAIRKLEIYVNGSKAQEFVVADSGFNQPFVFDASKVLTENNNRIEIRSSDDVNLTMAQIVSTFYVAWKAAKTDARYFDLKIDFDKIEAKVGEEIVCRVAVERKYDRYGMILAEIGLPPGADIDRAGLEKAKAENRFSSFDVLPDKILIYAWSQSFPMNFSFKFKPRFGIKAVTAPSLVYDYYNESARTVVAPTEFVVQ